MSKLAELFAETYDLLDNRNTTENDLKAHYNEICRHVGLSAPLLRKLESGEDISENEHQIIDANIEAGGRREAFRLFEELIDTAANPEISWKDFKSKAFATKEDIEILTSCDFGSYIESKNGLIHKIDENRWQIAFDKRMNMPRPRRRLADILGM